ncbi:Uma2 family endonuclease [Cylindrospermum sp. FACHB-282]|uniref:Uma2 family endonuclease n=1 Tax=Cylindrospermum sp. FACHB-282 TaxID=2692794 RepID=UPI00168538DB|nr:Uma2 family endonuclease [Cylindrospermum sp. FACHB-282]MBD2385537.1 Uma2 family endonuclease [Cylindrospermum sp. FACHB-282]
MTSASNRPYSETTLPDHTQLPESDGTFVSQSLAGVPPVVRTGAKNWQEHPQSILLTDSIQPVLQKLYPDSQYFIGQDLGIYWRITEPPEKGAEAPDWFYVPNVPPALNGQPRRSYVLWQEYISPLIVLEFVSGNGAEERDKTPWKGTFWIYEQVIKPAFYGIYEVNKSSVEIYHVIEGKYQLLPANERGHYPITPMGVELGLWQGEYQNAELPWLRWWDLQGNLLLTGEERANRLAAQLRALGVEPEA